MIINKRVFNDELRINNYEGLSQILNFRFQFCAFRAFLGQDELEIYLKYELEKDGLQILIFSNHIPNFPMNQPFKN